MRIRIGFDIITQQTAPTPMVLLLHTRPELQPALVCPEELEITPEVSHHLFIDSFGNRSVRLVAPVGTLRLHSDTMIEDDGEPDPIVPTAVQHPIEDLPDDCLPFLLASRYCEVDLLSKFAWEMFGKTEAGWGRVQAVCDFVHSHITFGYQHAHHTKTAKDVLEEGKGVCRDYQHLAVALCRALGVPARYCSGYIGSIRVPSESAVDFSAWFEVFLGGTWHAFDARYNTPRIGRTLMCVGRDAADTALITSFGAHTLEKFEVYCEEVE
jgi:transglutaminase-like putative cysteine protease